MLSKVRHRRTRGPVEAEPILLWTSCNARITTTSRDLCTSRDLNHLVWHQNRRDSMRKRQARSILSSILRIRCYVTDNQLPYRCITMAEYTHIRSFPCIEIVFRTKSGANCLSRVLSGEHTLCWCIHLNTVTTAKPTINCLSIKITFSVF